MDDHVEFELWQDDMVVASTEGRRADAWTQIQHYALVYGQDGPVKIYEVTRRLIEGDQP